jgi:GxxExxY protein
MLYYKDESYAIIGAIFEVYKTLGNTFIESFYQKALEHEFRLRNIPFVSQKHIPAIYKGQEIGYFTPDIICYDRIIVELKARENTTEEEQKQVVNYLTIGGYDLGILVNFGTYPKVYVQRILRKGATLPSVEEEEPPYYFE